MFASLYLLIAACVSLGESTVLRLVGDAAGAGGLQFGINGGGWGSGIAGTTAGRGELGGQLVFGYAGSGLKLPLVPIIGIGPTRPPAPGNNQQRLQPGHGFILGGQGSYSLQGQGGFPIHFGIPHYGQGYPGSPTAQEGGAIPQAGNVGGNNPQPGLPQQGSYFPNGNQGSPAGYPSQPNNVPPQFPQAGYPNQGEYVPQYQQPGYPSQGGFIPHNPQTGYPSHQIPQAGHPPNQGVYVPPRRVRPYPGGPDERPLIDPRKKDDRAPGRPTLQGRRRTPKPEPETTENPDTLESPTPVDEDADENTIPEDIEEK